MELSKRQSEVIQRVAQGRSDKAIASELGISIYTVRAHIEHIAAQIPGEISRRNRLMLFVLNVREPQAD